MNPTAFHLGRRQKVAVIYLDCMPVVLLVDALGNRRARFVKPMEDNWQKWKIWQNYWVFRICLFPVPNGGLELATSIFYCENNHLYSNLYIPEEKEEHIDGCPVLSFQDHQICGEEENQITTEDLRTVFICLLFMGISWMMLHALTLYIMTFPLIHYVKNKLLSDTEIKLIVRNLYGNYFEILARITQFCYFSCKILGQNDESFKMEPIPKKRRYIITILTVITHFGWFVSVL